MKTVLTSCLAFVLALSLQAQDPEFTQVTSNFPYFNPAATGINSQSNVWGTLRDQWSDTYVTSVLGYEHYLNQYHSSAGIRLMNDVAGTAMPIHTNSVALSLAHTIRMKSGLCLSGGLEGSYVTRSVSFLTTSPTNPIDSANLKKSFINAGLGVLASFRNFYAGLAVQNVFSPVQSFFNNPAGRVPQRYVTQLGGFIPLSQDQEKGWLLHLSFLYMAQGNFSQLLPGIAVSKGIVTVGVSARQTDPNFDALNFHIGINPGRFKIGYSYDKTFSDAHFAAPYSHELHLAVYLGKKPDAAAMHPLAVKFRRMF